MLGRPASLWVALVVLATAATCADPAADQEQWVGWLPTTFGAFESSAVWLSMLTGVSGAWVVGQPRAHGLSEWVASSPRPLAQRLRPALIFGLTGTWAGAAVAMLAMTAWSWRFGLRAGLAAPMLGLIVPTVAAYVLTWQGVGVWLGLRLPRALAMPLSAVVPYVGFALLAYYLDDGPAGILAVGDGRVFAYVRPTDATLAVRLAFWLVAGACVWAGLLAHRSGTGGLLRRGLPWVLSLTAAVALLQGPAFEPIPNAAAAVCSGSQPVTCLDGSYATAMSRYRAAVSHWWPDVPRPLRPRAVGAFPDVLRAERGETLVVPPVAGFEMPSRLVDERMFGARLGDALFFSECTLHSTGSRSAEELELWWRLSHGLPTDGSAYVGDVVDAAELPHSAQAASAARSFQAAPAPDRAAWFAAHARQVRTCSVPDGAVVG